MNRRRKFTHIRALKAPAQHTTLLFIGDFDTPSEILLEHCHEGIKPLLQSRNMEILCAIPKLEIYRDPVIDCGLCTHCVCFS